MIIFTHTRLSAMCMDPFNNVWENPLIWRYKGSWACVHSRQRALASCGFIWSTLSHFQARKGLSEQFGTFRDHYGLFPKMLWSAVELFLIMANVLKLVLLHQTLCQAPYMLFSFQFFNTPILQMNQLRLSEVTQLPTAHSLEVIEPGVSNHRAQWSAPYRWLFNLPGHKYDLGLFDKYRFLGSPQTFWIRLREAWFSSLAARWNHLEAFWKTHAWVPPSEMVS